MFLAAPRAAPSAALRALTVMTWGDFMPPFLDQTPASLYPASR